MASRPKALYRAAKTTTAAVNTAVPASKQWVITNVVIANSHATVTTKVTVQLDGVAFIPGVTLVPGALFTLDCKQVLDAGKNVTVSLDVVSNISFHISGVETDVV